MRTRSVPIAVARGFSTPVAGPYRALACRSLALEGVTDGVLTWLGILLGLPAFVLLTARDELGKPGFFAAWIALIVCGWLQTTLQWLGRRPQDESGDARCWWGSAEPLFAAGLCLAALTFCGAGVSLFFAAGYAASRLKLGLAWLDRRLAAWTNEDTERVTAPLRTGKAFVADVTRGEGQPAASSMGAASAAATPPRGFAARAFRRLFVKPAPATTQPTILGRYTRFVGWSLVFNTISSTLGLNLLALPLVVVLWVMGFKIEFPERIKEQWREFVVTARGWLGEKKDDMKLEIAERREEIDERIDRLKDMAADKIEEHRDEIRERVGRYKDEVADEIEERASRAMGKAVRRGIFGN